jgi:hypothetical protein
MHLRETGWNGMDWIDLDQDRDQWSALVKSECEISGRSQWPRDLRHEQSSPARTLGWWVRISVKAWMRVCVYSVCRQRPCNGLIPRPRSPAD